MNTWLNAYTDKIAYIVSDGIWFMFLILHQEGKSTFKLCGWLFQKHQCNVTQNKIWFVALPPASTKPPGNSKARKTQSERSCALRKQPCINISLAWNANFLSLCSRRKKWKKEMVSWSRLRLGYEHWIFMTALGPWKFYVQFVFLWTNRCIEFQITNLHLEQYRVTLMLPYHPV